MFGEYQQVSSCGDIWSEHYLVKFHWYSKPLKHWYIVQCLKGTSWINQQSQKLIKCRKAALWCTLCYEMYVYTILEGVYDTVYCPLFKMAMTFLIAGLMLTTNWTLNSILTLTSKLQLRWLRPFLRYSMCLSLYSIGLCVCQQQLEMMSLLCGSCDVYLEG